MAIEDNNFIPDLPEYYEVSVLIRVEFPHGFRDFSRLRRTLYENMGDPDDRNNPDSYLRWEISRELGDYVGIGGIQYQWQKVFFREKEDVVWFKLLWDELQ